MWPFGNKLRIDKSGILQGFTDWHCHLLPGVDDGVQTKEETLQLLALYEHQGIREVWLTPHIMEDIPNTTQRLRNRFGELQNTYKGPITLHLAAEHMLDSLFEERLAAGDVLPLGKDGRHLLVETSYFNPPFGLNEVLLRIKSKGYVPVLAHPERYVYMDKDDYRQLRTLNVKMQLNLGSLAGIYGPEAKQKAEWLLKNQYYSYTGTDTHRKQVWEHTVRLKVGKEWLERL